MCGKERDEYYDEEEEATREWEKEILDALTIPDEEDEERNVFCYTIWFPSHKKRREVVIDLRRLKIIGVALAILSLEVERADVESDLGRELKEYLAEVVEKKQEFHNLIDAMLDYARKSLFEMARRESEQLTFTYEDAIIDYNDTIHDIVDYMITFEEVIVDALDEFFNPDATDLWHVAVHEEGEKLYEKRMEETPRLGITGKIEVDEEQFLMWADDFEEKLKEWEKWIEDFKKWFLTKWKEVR